MKRPKFRRFGVSTGAKVQQENMRRLAKQMAKDPTMLIPECVGDCIRCNFDRLKIKLQRIQKFKDNVGFLNRLARGGKQLERGYAAMLLLAADDKPIMFATAKLPSGDVNYAVRGKVKKEVLIGLEHFDDVELSLLAYSELAVKRGLHIYSSPDGVFCSGIRPNYPKEIISEVLKSTGYSFRKVKGEFRCEHLAGDDAHGRILNIDIISADESISICKSCASKKKNLYAALRARVMCKRPERDLAVSLEQRMDCVSKDACSIDHLSFETSKMLERYRYGSLSDRELLEEYGKVVRANLDNVSGRVLIVGERCFEKDASAFIDALDPTDIERKALKTVLKATTGPIVVDHATPSAVLSQYWDRLGARIIHSVIGDKELAKKKFADTKDTDKTPAQILREAELESKTRGVLKALPEFRNLGKIGSFADKIARTYKTLGKQEALRAIDKAAKPDTKTKSVSCGLLQALGALKGKEWQFTKEEQDYGNYLAEFSKALLESEPEEYKDAMANLLTASGSGESLE